MSTATEAPPTEPTEPTEPEPPQTDEPPEDDDASARKAAAADGSNDLEVKAKAAERDYRRKLGRIFGSDVTLYECPHCEGRGVNFTPEPDDGVPSDVVHPENLETCSTCNGYGEVLTGSKNPQHVTTICTTCAARGYITKAAPAPAYEPPAPVAPAAPQTVAGQWVPGRGFIPYGSDEPLPNTVGLA